jgi:catechol 2,3-dioxygenase-like lactoylglutathione lyase family enzyme
MDQGNKVHHVAIYVKDIVWYIDFFEKALSMKVKNYEGPKAHPTQAWLDGGIQLIEKAALRDGTDGHMAHIGIECGNQKKAVERVREYAAATCPQGDNWLRMPDGLVLELM